MHAKESAKGSHDLSFLVPGLILHLEVEGENVGRLRLLAREDRQLELTTIAPESEVSPAVRGARTIKLIHFAPDAVYAITVESRQSPGRSRFVCRAVEEPPVRIQRREHFRMAVAFPMLVSLPNSGWRGLPRAGVPYLPPQIDGPDYRILRLRDMSGGGCRCVGAEVWMEPGTVVTGFVYLGDGAGPLAVKLLVVRTFGNGRGREVAFQFVEMKERRRERILRALFREYRRQRLTQQETA